MVSLGCDKNLCDSETMLGILAEKGYNITNDESEADCVIVNTCGFIKDAMQESIDTLLEMAQLKEGRLKYLIACGCLAERFKGEITDEIPEIDAVVGTTAFDKIAEVIERLDNPGADTDDSISLDKNGRPSVICDLDRLVAPETGRVITSSPYMAYLKIAEGCNKRCTYCIIPKLRGNYRSVPMERLITEAKSLAEQGIKELILVAQETSSYGVDIYGEKRLHTLIQALAAIDGIEWIRLMYCYPEEIYDGLIDCFKHEKKLLHYIDMPIQHSEDAILKRMGRKTDKESIKKVIGKLREAAPDIAIRTTLIAGFPGETDEDHEALMGFIDEMEFDRLGVFTYSAEDGTPAAVMTDQVPSEKAEQYLKDIMELQQEISMDKNETLTGQTLPCIIEGYEPDENVYVARSYRDAPGVDGLVFVNSDRELMSGALVDVHITDAAEYDLVGDFIGYTES